MQGIRRLAAMLRDAAAPPPKRLEALEFVVDFVADIHQTRHCADDGDARQRRHVVGYGVPEPPAPILAPIVGPSSVTSKRRQQ